MKRYCMTMIGFSMLVESVVFSFAAYAANLLPNEFIPDNAGGFCGWDTKGARIEALSDVGPDGKTAVRIAGIVEPLRFSVENMQLIEGGRYRLSAYVRTKGLVKRVGTFCISFTVYA